VWFFTFASSRKGRGKKKEEAKGFFDRSPTDIETKKRRSRRTEKYLVSISNKHQTNTSHTHI